MPLSFKDLCEKYAVKQPAALKRLLKARGIKYIPDAKGHPTTTEAAIDRAIQGDTKKITFTAPPCKKPNSSSRRESARNTARGTSSTSTSGQSYAE